MGSLQCQVAFFFGGFFFLRLWVFSFPLNYFQFAQWATPNHVKYLFTGSIFNIPMDHETILQSNLIVPPSVRGMGMTKHLFVNISKEFPGNHYNFVCKLNFVYSHKISFPRPATIFRSLPEGGELLDLCRFHGLVALVLFLEVWGIQFLIHCISHV